VKYLVVGYGRDYDRWRRENPDKAETSMHVRDERWLRGISFADTEMVLLHNYMDVLNGRTDMLEYAQARIDAEKELARSMRGSFVLEGNIFMGYPSVSNMLPSRSFMLEGFDYGVDPAWMVSGMNYPLSAVTKIKASEDGKAINEEQAEQAKREAERRLAGAVTRKVVPKGGAS